MLSIIVPIFNQWEMTCECLDSIRANTTDYELILVDNGSDPPFPGSTIRNETNLGFPAAVNQGIKAAKGDIIILLNNDTIVTPHWAERLMAYLDTYSIVGPVTNYAAGEQNVSIPTYNDLVELYCEAEKWNIEHQGELIEVRFIIGFCMVFKKSLFDEIGEFDASLWPCSGEEIDFCMRVKEAGHRIAVVREVYIHHHGTQTFKVLYDSGLIDTYEDLCKRNDKHLAERWGEGFWGKQRIMEAMKLGAVRP